MLKILMYKMNFQQKAPQIILNKGDINASVLAPDVIPPKFFDSMKQWCGPCWNTGENFILWQIDSEWSANRVDDNYQITVKRDLQLLDRFINSDCLLSSDEYAYMSEKGFIKTELDPNGHFKASLKIVWIRDDETKQKLIGIGDKLKEKYYDKFNELKAPLIKIIMDATPKHLRKAQAFGLQFMFYSDGWFLLYCIKELVENGKLKPPTKIKKIPLTTIIVPK